MIDRKNQKLTFDKPHKRAWFHVSSLGELEQAYPLIQALKKKQYSTLVSFYSHSGYEHGAKFKDIDEYILLPLDSKKNANELIISINPEIVFWTKNDFWLNTIKAISKADIPVILFSSIFYPSHFIFKRWASFFRKTLKDINHVFLQDQESMELLRNNGFTNVSISGDTRITRVKSRQQLSKPIQGIENYIDKEQLIILASVHEEDKAIIKSTIAHFKNHKVLIVPHNIGIKNITNLMSDINSADYNVVQDFTKTDSRVIVLDTVGMLFDLYRYADIVYVGGGFGRGIHNILEPTVFGKSVIFGPNYQKFSEAKTFLKNNLAYSCKSSDDYIGIISAINEKTKVNVANNLNQFYQSYPDSTEIIMDYCLTNKLIS